MEGSVYGRVGASEPKALARKVREVLEAKGFIVRPGSCPFCGGDVDFNAVGATTSWEIDCATCGGRLPALSQIDIDSLRREPRDERERLSRVLRAIERPVALSVSELRFLTPEKADAANQRRLAAKRG
jgi:hypothetical protein